MKNKERMILKKRILAILLALMFFISGFGSQNIAKAVAEYRVSLNEVETKDADGGSDFVEIYNHSDEDVDISGWYILDNDPAHISGTTPLPEGTILKAKAFYVFEENKDFTFGLGKEDSAILYDKDGNEVDSYTWTVGHAAGTFSRNPDGTGEWTDLPPTKGISNLTKVVEEPTPEEPPVEEPLVYGVSLNEVETKDANDGPDWVELYNHSKKDVDVSGWYVVDNDAGHEKDAVPLAEGTILKPGEYLVLEGDKDFTFGLGKNDSVTLYDKEGNVVDSFAWGDAHADGTYSRKPNGTGEWKDLSPTKGISNIPKSSIVINEIESNGDNTDWIEIYNNGSEDIDISGWFITDDGELSRLNDGETTPLAAGTVIKAGGYLIFDENANFTFGLGKQDKAILYNADKEIVDLHAWDGHATNGLSRIPNVTGDFKDVPTTRAAMNVDQVEVVEPKPELTPIAWPGKNTVEVIDKETMFLEDSSGLDYHDGHLYAVDNGTAIFWKLALDENGVPSKIPGMENGKRVLFKKDANNPDAKSPDAEGITVDSNGYVYIAVERDNAQKGVNFNNILMVDPNAKDDVITTMKEWDLTAHLPQVAANTGIETVEWISNADLAGKLYDDNHKAPYDPAKYTGPSINDGLFIVGVEDNGHLYAFRLNTDGTVILISEIDTKVGGVMGLNYDTETGILWAMADDGFKGVLTNIELNGTSEPKITHINPPADMDVALNNEGFAIAPSTYGPDCLKPAYWFMDGALKETLRMGWLNTVYKIVEEPEEPVKEPTEPVTEPEDPVEEPAAEVTLTFDYNGGSLNGKTSLEIKAKVGETIVIPAAPEKEGFEFDFWKGSEYQPGDKYLVEGDHTFTAMWKETATEAPKDDTTVDDNKETPTAPEETPTEDKDDSTVVTVTEQDDKTDDSKSADNEETTTITTSDSKSPKTGDAGVIAYLALAVSGVAALVASKKRK